eukprot:1924756-Rhodomonas_salina.1
MQTQFNLLLGNLPPNYDEDPLLIVYIALSIVVQFFLMLNFLLAIIIENYMKVRQHIEDMQTENEFMYDVYLTLRFGTVGIFSSWPNRRRLAKLLQTRNARRNTSWIEIFVLGIPRKVAIHMVATYRVLDVLPAKPAGERHTNMDRLGQMEERTLEHVSALEESVNLKFDAIMRLLQNQNGQQPTLSQPSSSTLHHLQLVDKPADNGKQLQDGHRSPMRDVDLAGAGQRPPNGARTQPSPIVSPTAQALKEPLSKPDRMPSVPLANDGASSFVKRVPSSWSPQVTRHPPSLFCACL